jgi:hypothetical protein
VLYGFGTHDEEKASSLLHDFLGHGEIIVDLFDQQTNPLQSPGLFGIVPQEISLVGRVPLKSLAGDVEEWNLEGLEQPWRAIGYYRLDSNMVTLEKDNIAILGTRIVEGKPVFFFGGNWFYYAYSKKDEQSIEVLRSVVSASLNPLREYNFEARRVSFTPQNDIVEFSYSATVETPVLVSMIFSPHWKAYVDGVSQKTYDGDNLILLILPPGDHRVSLKFENLPLHTFANILSAATFFFLVSLLLRRKRDV